MHADQVPPAAPEGVSILDVDTLASPRDPVPYEAAVRTEGRPDHGRWSPGGSNLCFRPTIGNNTGKRRRPSSRWSDGP